MTPDSITRLADTIVSTEDGAAQFPELIAACGSHDKAVFQAANHGARQAFGHMLDVGLFTSRTAAKKKRASNTASVAAAAEVSLFLHQQYHAWYTALIARALAPDTPEAQAVFALRCLLAALALSPKAATSASTSNRELSAAAMQAMIQAVLTMQHEPQPAVWLLLAEQWADEYDDVRLLMLTELPHALAALPLSAREHALVRAVDFLRCITLPPSEEAWGERSFLVKPDLKAADEAEAGDSAGPDTDEELEGYAQAQELTALTGAASARAKRRRAALRARTGGVQALAAGSLASQRRAFQGAWLAVLRQPMPAAALRAALLHVAPGILPHLPDPLALADFLTRGVQQGGALALVALTGLFELMTKHGLNYPDFYDQLYRLCTPATVRAKYRRRFYALLDKFLSSAAMPAHMVAAFAKKLLHLASGAPPHVVKPLVALAFNVMKRHPGATHMVHAPAEGLPTDAGQAAGTLPVWQPVWRAGSPAPEQSDALADQLWELPYLLKHWHPSVAAMAAAFTRTWDRPAFEVDADRVAGMTWTDALAAACTATAAASPEAAAAVRKARWKRHRVPTAVVSELPVSIHAQAALDAVPGGVLRLGVGDDSAGVSAAIEAAQAVLADHVADSDAGSSSDSSSDDSDDSGNSGAGGEEPEWEVESLSSDGPDASALELLSTPVGSVPGVQAAVVNGKVGVNLWRHMFEA